MRDKIYILLTCAVAMLVAACGKSFEEKRAERHAAQQKVIADERASFKVAVKPTLDCLPIFLLKDSLLYDTAKADIRLKTFNSHADIDTALAGGSVQAAATELVRAVELRRMHHTPLRTVAATPLQWTLVGDKKNKITTLKSLENRMIAMSRFSATDWLYQRARQRVKTDSLILFAQINDIPLRSRMLGNDEMDAAWLPEPYATTQIVKGNVALMRSADEGRKFGIIVYREPPVSDTERREAQLQTFKAAYNKAVEMINRNGVKYYSNLIEKYMNVDSKTIDKLPKTTFAVCAPPAAADVKAAEKITFPKHTAKVKIR